MKEQFVLVNSALSEPDDALDTVSNHPCPRCGRMQLALYFSSRTEEKLGACCENCDLKGYFDGEELVSLRGTTNESRGVK